MVTPEIRRLQVLNDLIAQTLDVINQRSLLSSGLSHTPYAELGVPQVNPFLAQQLNPLLAQYGVPQTPIGQLAGAQVPFATPGMMHSPFVGLQGPFGQQQTFGQALFGQQPFGQAPFGQQPVGQFWTPYTAPWTQGLMHTPFTGYPIQRGIEGGIGFGPQGLGFGQQPFGQAVPQGVPPTAFPWSSIGFGAGRYGIPYGQYF